MCPDLSAEAKAQKHENPSRTICNIRLILGLRWWDTKLEETIKGLHYRVVEGPGHRPVITVDIKGREHRFTPEHITGLMMAKLRDAAAARIGEEVGFAVVAKPHCFSVHQTEAIKNAGAAIGLEVLRFLNEYTAAIIAYGLDLKDGESNVIVMDLGASKTDVTFVYIDEGVVEPLAFVSEPTNGRMYNRQLVD